MTALDDAQPGLLTAVILTRNEAIHLARCLRALDGLATRIVIVDSGSTDATAAIAREHGAEVFERAWVNYADQFQWALDNAGIGTDWIMRLDADEVVGPDLAANLKAAMGAADPGTAAFSVDRRHIFMGRWIRHGGRYPLRLVRVWRRGCGRIEQRWMDEHIAISGGATLHVAGDLSDINLNDLTFFTAKHNAYATREALDALIDVHGLFETDRAEGVGASHQAERRRIAKQGFYNRLPLGLGPLAFFLLRYIVQLGFLDGKPGLIYHGLQGLWYRFLVDAKRHELERELSTCADNDARIDRLSALTGHDLRAFAAATGQRVRR
ncbi:glycosyltransferase family 2 protein [Parablastomonas sp. CN1-191]|uniref:glycosyltransferase family 2 protein n=1 Tax=Parablastomonas sp. CN1-191 TaxID=3400908 RepID=UPI003BF7F86E